MNNRNIESGIRKMIEDDLREHNKLLQEIIVDLKASKELLIDDYKHLKNVVNVMKQQNHKKEEKIVRFQRVLDKEGINLNSYE